MVARTLNSSDQLTVVVDADDDSHDDVAASLVECHP